MKFHHLGLAGLAVGLALTGCSKPAPQAEAVRPVRSVVLGSAASQAGSFHAGEIRARHEARLAFRVGGKVVARLVDVGAEVKAGQALARLESNDVALDLAARRAKLAAAEADWKQNEADIRRYRELLAQNFISQAEFDRRTSALAAAKGGYEAALATAQLGENQQHYTTLNADRAGVVTYLDAEIGQVVNAGQVVARVAEPGATTPPPAPPTGAAGPPATPSWPAWPAPAHPPWPWPATRPGKPRPSMPPAPCAATPCLPGSAGPTTTGNRPLMCCTTRKMAAACSLPHLPGRATG